jgi:uncharacterized protein (TIGR04255 family)
MLTFPSHEDVVFEHAPLTSVICQVKFPPIYPLISASAVVGFQESLSGTYFAADPDVGASTAQMVNGKVVNIGQTPTTWRFIDTSGNWIVGLSVDFISLESKAYTSIAEFSQRMTDLLTVLYRVLRPRDATRVGLRKINAFEFDDAHPSEMSTMLRPEIAGVLGDDILAPALTNYASQFELRDDDDTALVVRTGPIRAGDRVSFILDMDYATLRPYPIDDSGNLGEVLREFSEGITSFFHWALLDEFKATLGPRPRVEMESHT